MSNLGAYRTGDFYSSPYGSARVITSDEQSIAVALERQCAKELLPPWYSALGIFVGSSVCYVTVYGLFALAFALLLS